MEYFCGPEPPLRTVLNLAGEGERILAEQIAELERDLLYLAVTDPPEVKRLSDLKAVLALYQEARVWIEGERPDKKE